MRRGRVRGGARRARAGRLLKEWYHPREAEGGNLDEREVALLDGAHERGEAVDVLLGCARAACLEEVLRHLEVPLAAGVVERIIPAIVA